ncbi:MAG: hypothetical protein QOH56_2277 [Pseudonocardiales bacterium]|nr:hypothetical protein [Pseudonocardiales bacterium]
MTNSMLRDAEERVEDGPLGRFIAPVTDNWWLLLVTGIAWFLVSIVIFRFDYTTVAAVSVLFGIVALGAAANEVLLATVSSKGWRVAYLVMAGLSSVVAIVSFIHPGDTFVALAALVSFYLVFRGSFDLIMAFSLSRSLPGWWLLVITAIAELLIGFWAAGSWNNSVVVLVAWVGAAALTRGITEIVGAFELRDVGRTVSR